MIKVREKLGIKDGDFVDYLQDMDQLNNQIRIWLEKTMKQVDSLRKRKLLLS